MSRPPYPPPHRGGPPGPPWSGPPQQRPPAGRGCPECGRPVPPDAKLCPSCGYPLLLDRPAAPEHEPNKIVYKPTAAPEDVEFAAAPPLPATGGRPAQRYAPPARAAVPGPHCPRCHTVNSPHRRRCEVCAQELWPGAAAPAQWMPQPPTIMPPPPRRRQWWKLPLLIGLPIVVMATVWLLALVL